MQTLKDWLNSGFQEIKAIQNKSWWELLNSSFHRQEYAPASTNSSFLLSPVHGTVISQKVVKKASDKILNVKGSKLSLEDLVGDKENLLESKDGWLVYDIFLTCYDIHSITAPATGYYTSFKLPCLETHNLPMLNVEKELTSDIEKASALNKINEDNFEYLYTNERWLYYCTTNERSAIPGFQFTCVADAEVNAIIDYCGINNGYNLGKGEHLLANDLIGKIMLGSHSTVIIPLNNKEYKVKSMIPEKGLYHLDGGKDKLCQFVWNDEE